MYTFFDLATVLAIAEYAHATGGEEHAALVWQLAGAPVISAHPADADAPPAQVYDDQWLTRRWPQLTVADLATDPTIYPHFTAEYLPLADADKLLPALRHGLADGWTLLAIDIDEHEITWYLARSRRRKHPKKLLGQRERRSQHPLLTALAAAGFTNRNFPPGLDHWTSSRWGQRYHVWVTVSTASIEMTCSLRTPQPQWHISLRADVPAEIAAAIAIAISQINDTEAAPPAA